VVVIDHPLLVETGRRVGSTRSSWSWHRRPCGLQRLADERGMDPEDVRARMAAQATDAERRAVATHVVDNSGDLASLLAQVDRIHADLLARARTRRRGLTVGARSAGVGARAGRAVRARGRSMSHADCGFG
jgi:dephospho-CoA kinase